MNSKKQKVKFRKLVSKECACYDTSAKGIRYIRNIPQSIIIKDYCDREQDKDYRCLIFKGERCNYFEEIVLPLNPQLEALYKAEHIAEEVGYEFTKEDRENIIETESSIKGKVKIHCKKCDKIFEADNYRQQYCDKCKKIIRRENNWKEYKKTKEITIQ